MAMLVLNDLSIVFPQFDAITSENQGFTGIIQCLKLTLSDQTILVSYSSRFGEEAKSICFHQKPSEMNFPGKMFKIIVTTLNVLSELKLKEYR